MSFYKSCVFQFLHALTRPRGRICADLDFGGVLRAVMFVGMNHHAASDLNVLNVGSGALDERTRMEP
jgi:hypothetical protein